jgi:hypothetical protein
VQAVIEPRQSGELKTLVGKAHGQRQALLVFPVFLLHFNPQVWSSHRCVANAGLLFFLLELAIIDNANLYSKSLQIIHKQA